MHYMDANKKKNGQKAWGQLHKNAVSNMEEVTQAAPHKAAAIQPPTPYHKKNSKLDELDLQDTAREVGTSS